MIRRFVARSRWLLPVIAAFVIALLAVPAGAATTGTVSTTASSITPGAATDVTVVFTSGDTNPAVLTVFVTPQTGATGTFTLSGPVTSTGGTSGSFACFVTPPDRLDCLWQTSGSNTKDPGDQATVTVTATSSSDALGLFNATAFDDTFATPGTGTVLGTAPVTVALPPTTTTTTTTAPTTTSTTLPSTAAPTSATTTAPTAQATAAGSDTKFARTGGDPAPLAVAALGMLAIGSGLVFASRRRRAVRT